MAIATIDFDAADLAARAECASAFELDNLPFGVIRLDRDGTVQFYSATEARLSGYGEIPVGKNLFAISECLGNDDFRGRVERAMDAGPVDLEIGWPGDFGDPRRELRIRVQSPHNGGL
jgi:photoactive yellow protein